MENMDCVYKNPNKPIEACVKDLLSQMTLKRKIGQTTQIIIIIFKCIQAVVILD